MTWLPLSPFSNKAKNPTMAESNTKRTLNQTQIAQIIADAFGSHVQVAEVSDLTDGMYNSSYKIKIIHQHDHQNTRQNKDTPKTVVLKVAPPPNVEVMTYEKDIMKSEYVVNQILRKSSSVPTPAILYHNFNKTIIDSDILIFECLYGPSLHNIKQELTHQQLATIRHETGKYIRNMQQCTGEFFGYIADSADTSKLRGSTWFEAFSRMFEAVLQEAKKKSVRLPVPKKRLKHIVQENASSFLEVQKPVLNHFDVWDGNVFVQRDGENCFVEAIIDCERAFYGDPLCDLISSVNLFGDIRKEKDFLTGYYSADPCNVGDISFSNSQLFRLYMYKLYLYLIMLVETAYRDSGSWLYKRFIRHHIRSGYGQARRYGEMVRA